MKKRIISLILVVVMLALSLVGCGYSFAKDDLSAHATFSDAKKAAFEEALKNLLIEDGDFTTDSAKRAKLVMETVYKSFASSVKAEDAKTEGVPGAHDLLKYCYYVTAEIDGETHIFSTSTMNTNSAVQLQFGIDYSDANASAAVVAALAGFDFTKKNYTSVLSGTAEPLDVAFVSYSYSYTVTDDAGVKTEKTGTVTYDRMVIAAAPAENQKPATLASYLAKKAIGSSLSEVTIADAEKGDVKYSNIKIHWVAKGDEATSFKDVTYTKENKAKDSFGKEYDLNNVELTYHIYPVSYTPVKEYTPANVLEIIGSGITANTLYAYILGTKYVGLDEKNEDDKALLEERANLLKDYKTADGKTLETVATELAKLYDAINNTSSGTLKAYDDAKKAQKSADDALNGTNGAIAKLEAEKAKETPDAEKIKEYEDAVTKATTALETANTNLQKAEKSHNDKVAEKDTLLKALLEIKVNDETVEAKIERGYRIAAYETLQNYDIDKQILGYNYEIKMNLAKEIYYYLVTNPDTCVDVNSVPKEAVEKTYKQLIDNYKHDFYEEATEEDSKVSNYKKYDGSFKKYLISVMKKEHPTVKTYKDALKAVREDAAEYVKPLVAIYYAADVYGLTVTDKEIKEYKETDEYLTASTYGKNTAIHGYQFDKLMDYFLEYEEKETKDGEYTMVTFEYKKVAYKFGTPASEKEETTEEETEKE